MNTKQVIGRKIVAVKQSRVCFGRNCVFSVVEEVVLDNGVRLRTHALETEMEPVGDLLVVKRSRSEK